MAAQRAEVRGKELPSSLEACFAAGFVRSGSYPTMTGVIFLSGFIVRDLVRKRRAAAVTASSASTVAGAMGPISEKRTGIMRVAASIEFEKYFCLFWGPLTSMQTKQARAGTAATQLISSTDPPLWPCTNASFASLFDMGTVKYLKCQNKAIRNARSLPSPSLTKKAATQLFAHRLKRIQCKAVYKLFRIDKVSILHSESYAYLPWTSTSRVFVHT